MKKKVLIKTAVVVLLGVGAQAAPQDYFLQAKNFTDAELAMSGLKIARSMVEADCKGRVFWADSSVGKSGYAASYAQLREEGFSKKEMRRASKHRTMAIQAFGMWMYEAGFDFAEGELDTDQICEYVVSVSGTSHPIGRFLVKD